MNDPKNKNKNNKTNYSRRKFLKHSLLGVGATALFPSFLVPGTQAEQKYYEQWNAMEALPDDEKLNIALVGLGSYATYQLAPALQHTKFCRLNGIVTGTPSKEEVWADKYGIPEKNIYNYETYDQIADNPDIDIMYIVLPNGMHAEFSIRAAQAGKHVISEKPMATSVEDCQAMIDTCEENDRKLSIGYRLHFEPHNEEMMRLGQNEVFGPVQSIAGGHSFTLGGSPDRWRLDKELSGGGPLMDVGIYAVQGAIYTAGELPVAVTAREETNNTQRFDEVEESIYWTLEFPSGFTAEGESSYSEGANYLRADAGDGSFSLSPAFSYGGVSGKTSEGPMDFPEVRQQTLQMDAFADCIFNDRKSRVPGEMGLRDVKILMAIYEAAETGERVELDL